MRLVVTIFEPTAEKAIAAIGSLNSDHDLVEIRLDALANPQTDLRPFRQATAKPIIATLRGGGHVEFDRAFAAGIDFVDVEYAPGVELGPHPSRVVVSHHDFHGVPDLGPLLVRMRALGCGYTKVAVTPRNFAENRAVLEAAGNGVTMIGMGERGLYSRIAAPFYGSELQFVSVDDRRSAAPGQLSLDRALDIYGQQRESLRAAHLFAVIGNPAGHSGSPAIHNRRFRQRGVAAAYTIASTDSFTDVADPFARGVRFAPAGLSVTAPFKEEAFEFAQRVGARVGRNATEAGAVNTLLRGSDGFFADNTDIDGFLSILQEVCGSERKSVAIVGAGGTARAALVATRRAGMRAVVYNRTADRARTFADRVESLAMLARFDGEIVINTLPAGVEVPMPLRPGMTYIQAAYASSPSSSADERPHQSALDGIQQFSGFDLLAAQAIRQNDLFVAVCNGEPLQDRIQTS